MVLTAPQPPADLAPAAPESSDELLDRPLLAGFAINWELAAYVGLVLLALVLRLVVLGDKPFHHDESQDAYFSWVFFTGGGYKYDPLLHGPFRFYLIALSYLLFGVSNFTARIPPALMGTIMVALPYFLRRQLGAVAAFTAAALFALAPAYLYFSRFTREDIYIACLTLAMLVVAFRFLAKPRPWQPALLFGLLAASFATKESTYITVFIAGTFFLAALTWQALQARAAGLRFGATPLAATIRSVGVDGWLWAAAAFIAVFTVLFTTFFFNPQGLHDGIVKSIQYWLSQQPVGRGGEPWYYYLVLLPAYDWPMLILGALGVVAALRRPTLLKLFLIWFFVLSLGIYSWAGEKMPWLLIHILLPLLFLAGIGVQELWRQRARLAGKLGLGIAALGAVYLLHATTALSYGHPANPEEFLVYTQTSTAVPRVVDQIAAIDKRVYDASTPNTHLKLDIDTTDGVDWPWAWYLRDLKTASYVDMSSQSYAPTADALLIDDANRAQLQSKLANYTGYKFPLRVWWIPDFQHATLHDWWNWLLWRQPWPTSGQQNPEGSLDEWLYVRNDVPGVSIVGGTNGATAGAGAAAVGAAVPLPAPTTVDAVRAIDPQANGKHVLDQPRQLAVLPDGAILVVDQGTSQVTKLDPSGKVVAAYAGAGADALKNPTGLAVDQQGNVFIADTWNHRVVKLDSSLRFVTAWGKNGVTNGQAVGHPAEFYGPRSVAVDQQGDVFVTDTGNKRIQEFDNNGKFLTQFGGGGAAPGQLNEPVGLAFTPQGSLVVADTWNRRVQVLTAAGQPLAQWQVPDWQTNVHNEPYVAVGPDGDIYVSDPNVQPGRILVYGPDGQPLADWVLSGAGLSLPTGLAVGPNNQLYVTDSMHQRIVVLQGK